MSLPEMTLPEIRSFEQIVALARERVNATKKRRAALISPCDPDMLKACEKAMRKGFLDPMIVGDLANFESVNNETQANLKPSQLIDAATPAKAVILAAQMAAKGEIDLIVKGRSQTAEMLAALLSHDAQFVAKGKVMSHVAVMKPERYKKLLMLTDGGVVIAPDLQTKMNLIQNLIKVSKSIGIPNPRIAVLAAVEVVYPTMPVTTEAAILSKMAERGQIKEAYIDGPLSLDVAVDMFAAHSKGVKSSQVAGQADAFLAPNIETANGIYKAMTLYGNCEMAGVIVGGRVPVTIGSRSDNEQSKFNSIALGVLAG